MIVTDSTAVSDNSTLEIFSYISVSESTAVSDFLGPHPTVVAKGTTSAAAVSSLTLANVVCNTGDLLIVTVIGTNNITVTWNGIAMSAAVSLQSFSSTNSVYIFYLAIASGASGSVVASWSGSHSSGLTATTVQGGIVAVDQTASNSGDSNSPSSGATSVTSQPNEIAWGAIEFLGIGLAPGGSTGNWNNSWIDDQRADVPSTLNALDDGYLILSSEGAQTASKNFATSCTWGAVCATFKVPALQLFYPCIVSDSTAVTDTPTVAISPNVSVSDSSAVTDGCSVEIFNNVSVSESTAVTDNNTLEGILNVFEANTQLATDNFNRVNGGLGANWTNIQNAPVIAGDLVQGSGANVICTAYYSAITFPPDQYSQVVVPSFTSDSSLQLFVRKSSSNSSGYALLIAATTGLIQIYHNDTSGGFNLIASTTYVVSSGDTVTFAAVGSTLIVFVNGIAVLNTSDTKISSGYPGIGLEFVSGGASSVEISDWIGGFTGDITAVTDAVALVVGNPNVTASDSTAVTDLGLCVVANVLSVADSTAITDSSTLQLVYSFIVSDSTAVTDVPSFGGIETVAIGRQIASDNFTRANGGLGPNWTNIDSPLQIVGNLVESNPSLSAGHSLYTAISWNPNQYSSVVLQACDVASSYAGVVVRGDPSGENCYVVVVSGPLGSPNTLSIYRFSPQVLLGEVTVNANSGDIVSATIIGSVITGFINGAAVLTVTETTYTTGTPGIFIQPTSSQSGVQLDNWVGGSPADFTPVSDVPFFEVVSYASTSDSTAVIDHVSAEIVFEFVVSDSTAVSDHATGEQIYEVFASDSTAVTDTSSLTLAAAILNISVSDSTAVTDTNNLEGLLYIFIGGGVLEGRSSVYGGLLFGSATFGGAVKLVGSQDTIGGDETTVTDAVSVEIVYNIQVSDSTAITDVGSASFGGSIFNSDTTIVTDVVALAVSSPNVFVTEFTGVADSTNLQLESYLSILDSSAVTDVPTVEITPGASVTDSTAVSDNSTLEIFSYISVSESTAVSDSSSVEIVDSVSVGDSTAVSDSTQITVTSPVLFISDSTAVTDTSTLEIFSYISVSESTAVSDHVTIQQVASILVADSSAVSDSSAFEIFDNVSVNDSSAVTDTPICSLSSYLSVSDSTAVSDSPTLEIFSYISVSESTAVSDTPKIEKIYFIGVADSTAVTDTFTGQATGTLIGTDTTAVTDVVTLTVSNPVFAISDSSAVTDVPTIEVVNNISVHESSAVSDSVSVEELDDVAVSDSSVISDVVTLQLIDYIDVSDSSAVSDVSVIQTSSPAVVVADSTAVSDSTSLEVFSNISVNDSTAVSDVPVVVIPGPAPVTSDSTAVSDLVTVAVSSPGVGVSESTAVNDSVLKIEVVTASRYPVKFTLLNCRNVKLEIQ